MVSLLRKLNLYFTKDTEAVHHFPGGGVQMLISIETHKHTWYFPGGGVSGPPIRLWIRAWAISS